MKILIINYEYPPLGGGGGKQSMYLARELAKSNSIYFLTAGYQEFGIVQKEGYILHKIKTSRKNKDQCSAAEMFSFVYRAWKEIPQIINQFQPEIILVYFTIPTGLLSFHPALRKIPYLISVRGSDVPGHNPDRFKALYFLSLPLVSRIWKKAKAVVCNSIGLKKEVLELNPELNVEIIPNGIDLEKFKLIKKLNSSEEINLLYVGRLIPLKQIDKVIVTLPKIITKTKKKVKFKIVGSGVQESELRSLVKKMDLNEAVIFVGDVNYETIEQEYQKADIYIQLSKIEGMSNTIMEALACGLPVITTDISGIDVLKNNNALKIINNLEKLPDLVLELAEKKITFPKIEEFSFNNIAKRYQELIDRINLRNNQGGMN